MHTTHVTLSPQEMLIRLMTGRLTCTFLFSRRPQIACMISFIGTTAGRRTARSLSPTSKSSQNLFKRRPTASVSTFPHFSGCFVSWGHQRVDSLGTVMWRIRLPAHP
eukprot:Rmarinus@m.143